MVPCAPYRGNRTVVYIGGPPLAGGLLCVSLLYKLCSIRFGKRSLLIIASPVGVSAPVSPRAVGEQVPEGDQHDGADQRAQERDVVDIDISHIGDDEDAGHQPDADDGGDDGAHEAKGEPPANNKFGDETKTHRHNQVDDECRTDGERAATNLDSHAIRQHRHHMRQERKHASLLHAGRETRLSPEELLFTLLNEISFGMSHVSSVLNKNADGGEGLADYVLSASPSPPSVWFC